MLEKYIRPQKKLGADLIDTESKSRVLFWRVSRSVLSSLGVIV
jgi:hypothetical protein